MSPSQAKHTGRRKPKFLESLSYIDSQFSTFRSNKAVGMACLHLGITIGPRDPVIHHLLEAGLRHQIHFALTFVM